MVGDASVNGLSSATQWMERCDSMDGTRHLNGLTIACPSPASPFPTFREKWEIWQGRNTRMGLTGRSGLRRRNGGIEAAGGVRRRVLRTQSVCAAAAEKVAGEEKCREQGRFLLGAVRVGRDG